MRIGYARVSTPDDALEQSAVPRYFEGGERGKSRTPVLTAALEYMRAADMLAVWRLDRLGRSLGQLIALMHTLQGLVRDTCNFRPQGDQSRKVDLLGRKTCYA